MASFNLKHNRFYVFVPQAVEEFSTTIYGDL